MDNADAPVSPLRSSPTVLEVRRGRGRGMSSLSIGFSGGPVAYSTAAILGKASIIVEKKGKKKKKGGMKNYAGETFCM